MDVFISPRIPVPLYFSILERLLHRSECSVSTGQDVGEFIDDREWQSFGYSVHNVTQVVSPSECDIALVMANEVDYIEHHSQMYAIITENPIENLHQNVVYFYIKDLLMYDKNSEISREILSWVKDGIRISDDIVRYWLSPRDASDAIVSCIGLDINQLPHHISVCGRRGWTLEQTYSEFKTLHHRWMQGKSGQYKQEDLLVNELPIRIQPFTGSMPSRPNLQPLHTLLLNVRSDGWRPYVPLRTMLMEVIASIEKL
ncbi:MAG: hypothetical protein VW270_17200 [Candidatus Poseidoniales archaeon]